jgi:hypothetical protein
MISENLLKEIEGTTRACLAGGTFLEKRRQSAKC